MTQVVKNSIINKAVTFNGEAYYFLKNLQGDVIAITNADGEVIARYTYDSEGELVKKSVTPSEGTKQVTYYETDDNASVTKLSVGGRIVTSHSKTDSFGRKVFDELQLGKGFVSRQYIYHGGEITQEHKESSLVKSTPTSQLVSRVILSDGTELSYGYDAEERISHVVETRLVGGAPVTNTTLYTYNANGIRTGKVVNGAAHSYTLDVMNILREVWGENELTTIYDNEEAVCGISFNGAAYFFLKNLQGDVIAITNADGDVIARYTYDAWGKILSVTDNVGNSVTDTSNVALVNPFRYRGYYYDSETELYYLNSRYYNPEVGRFVNADDVEWIAINEMPFGGNIFSYCRNDVINISDETGHGAIDSLIEALASCISVVADIITSLGKSYDKEKKQLESSVKLLNKKQKRTLSDIRALQEESKKLSKRLGWIGNALTFLSIAIGLTSTLSSSGIDNSIA